MSEGIAALLVKEQGQEPSPESEPELGASEAKAQEKETPDDLGVEEPDEKDGPKHVPLGRFIEENKKLKAAKGRVSELEKELETTRSSSQGVSKEFERLFGSFSDPLEYMRDAAEVSQRLWELRENPDVQKALKLIQEHRPGAIKAVTERPAAETTTEKTEPASDPRVEALVQERIRDQVERLLGEAKVRPELHGAIRGHVLSQNPNPSREDVLASMQEYVTSQGWTKQFLRGSPSKERPSPIPSPSGFAAGAPRQPQDKTAKAEDKPKTLGGIERQNRNRLQDLMRERGMSA